MHTRIEGIAGNFTAMIKAGRSEAYVLGWLEADGDLFWHRPYGCRVPAGACEDYLRGYEYRHVQDILEE